VFRSSPGDPHQQPQTACISTTHPHQHSHPQQPFDREALTAELVQFSRSLRYSCGLFRGDHLIGNRTQIICIYQNSLIRLAVSRSYRPLFAFRNLKSEIRIRIPLPPTISASNRFCPQWRRLSGAGSAPDLSGSHAHANTTNSTNATNHQNPTTTVTTNYYNLLSLNRLSPLDWELYCSHRRHRRHHHRHSHHHHHHHHKSSSSSVRRVRPVRPGLGAGSQPSGGGGGGGGGGAGSSSSARIISNSSSLIQRATRECSLLQPPAASRVYWQASSFDGGSNHPPGLGMSSGAEKRSERNKRSDTAKRHVLSRQRPIEQEEARDHSRSPLGHRR